MPDRSDLLKSFFVKEAAGEYETPGLLKNKALPRTSFTKILCKVRLCMFNLLAVSETFLLHIQISFEYAPTYPICRHRVDW